MDLDRKLVATTQRQRPGAMRLDVVGTSDLQPPNDISCLEVTKGGPTVREQLLELEVQVGIHCTHERLLLGLLILSFPGAQIRAGKSC